MIEMYNQSVGIIYYDNYVKTVIKMTQPTTTTTTNAHYIDSLSICLNGGGCGDRCHLAASVLFNKFLCEYKNKNLKIINPRLVTYIYIYNI